MLISRTIVAFLAASGLAAAQVPLSGSVYDGHGGPLLTGTVYHITNTVTVPADSTLTVQPGAIVKAWHEYVLVDGTLAVSASQAQPAVFTSLFDDGAGGDTNGDGGATQPAPGDWYGIQLRTGSVTSLDHALLRYHGYGGWSGLYIGSSSLALTATASTFADGGLAGIDLNGNRPTLAVTGCDFTGNAGYAVRSAPIDAVPGFLANTASGNGTDAIDVSNASPVAEASISGDNCLGGALVLNDTGIVPAGVTLTLRDGAVVKSWHRYVVVDGTLILDGTPALPVVFTSLLDDSVAGDTNKDGSASLPAPGDWYGFNPRAGSVTSLDNAVLRYHGYGGWSGLHITSSSLAVTATASAFNDGSVAGIDLNGYRPTLDVTGCAFTGNVGYAVRGVPIDSVPGFSGNTASGNGTDAIDVANVSPVADAIIGADNCLGGALVLNDSGIIPAGVTITLEPGVVIKSWHRYLIVDGTLRVLGSVLQPVVLTSLRDDSIGGDTKGDAGATMPAPGDWYGLSVRAASVGSRLENLLVRYAGYGGWAGLDSASGSLTASHVRIERADVVGLLLYDAGELVDVAVWASGSTGVYLISGDAVLRHLTSAANGAYGVYAFEGFAGSVESSVAWGNATTDWFIAPAGVVSYSDGLGVPAGLGNFAYDPLFRDVAAGDLRMQYGSPCIDNGDPDEVASGLDMAGFPRLMDGNLNLEKRRDMGAYEYDNLELALSANAVPGGMLDITTTDFAGFADCWLFVGTGMAETEAWRFGTLFVDPFLPWVVLFWPTIPATIPVEVPLDIPVGSTFVMQLGARLTAAPGTPGNLSNPVILTIE